jgi:hypothetical protein
MANCHDLFRHFIGQIELDTSKREDLKKAREALRKKIRGYFKENLKYTIPKFHGQGSYMMSTIINPLDGEYDIDDGIYLQNLDSEKSKWPDTQTVHKWIYASVIGHTKQDPINKRTCIRVVYSGEWHVDLPIYGIYKEEVYLAETGEKDWHISDPKSVNNWFKEEVKAKGEQLRDIVKYLKAWIDNQNEKEGETISGFMATILVVKHYITSERDDVSFAATIKNIYSDITTNFSIIHPIDEEEVLSDKLDKSEKDRFKKLLGTLVSDASKALDEINKKKACKIWLGEFGERFFNCDKLEDDKGALRTCSPALLKDDARSAKNIKRFL